MLKDITYCLLLSWLVLTSPISKATANYDLLIDTSYKKRHAGFGNIEHRQIGDDILLKWGHLPHKFENNHLQLSNGIVLSYGEIIMFAGDLFGSKDASISHCPQEYRQVCFYKQFRSLDKMNTNPSRNALHQIPVYRRYFNELSNKMRQAKLEGKSESQYYLQHGPEITKSLNRLSGGGSFISDYIPFGEYIQLASVNYDHFVPGALSAYETGHKVALDKAIEAHQADKSGDTEKAYTLLSKAYAMNGFANHFIMDAMSAGHFRTPRVEIEEHVLLPKALCLLIANLMHDEDNRVGLNVTNKLGFSWHAYGDGFLNTPEASHQLSLIHTLVQNSADAIYAAFESGEMPRHFDEMSLLPDYDRINQLNNHPPLFKWENNQLLKRKRNFDIDNNEYTSWWSGVITLIEFNQHDWSSLVD